MNSRKRERDHNHLAGDLGLKEVHDSLGVLSEALGIVEVCEGAVYHTKALFLTILNFYIDEDIYELLRPFSQGDCKAALNYSFSTKIFEHVVGSWVTSISVELVVSLTQD